MGKVHKAQSRASSINLLGGALCLDFANTVDWRTSDSPEEILASYRDLVDWSRHVGIIDERRANRLKRNAALHTVQASSALEQATELREAIYQVFISVAHARPPSRQALRTFNEVFLPLVSRAHISPVKQGFAWSWGGDRTALDSILWPVAWSAAELLTSQNLEAVRECMGGGCGWLFLDKSRSHRRQWCDMKGCGNRAKARRYYERLKSNNKVVES
jgi:predicted RNA-binding Zn ribbon-like protein